MAGKLSRIQKESGKMRKKITRGAPLILHHLKFSKKENENHQFLLCQKENKERKKIIRQAILNIKNREDKNHHKNYYYHT